jgi:Lysozyme like domain
MAFSAKEVYALARKGGFSPIEAVIATAIAGFRGSGPSESGGNPNAHNLNPTTGDDSYGLWQINMLGGLGPARRAAFGISSNEELLNPVTNAKAAYQVFKSQGWSAWSIFKSGAHKANLAGATSGAKGVEDPGVIDKIISGLGSFINNPVGAVTDPIADPIEKALAAGTNQLKRAGFTLVFGAMGLGLIALGAQMMVAGKALPTVRKAIGV